MCGFADVVVAFAPGAMDAMLALALTLHIDPIFVGAHHLSRFVFVTIATPASSTVRTAAGRRGRLRIAVTVRSASSRIKGHDSDALCRRCPTAAIAAIDSEISTL